MESRTIRIALSSVLIYVIFKKLYAILDKLLIWINVDLRFESEFILLAEYVAVGLLSLGLLVYFYNRYLKKEMPNSRAIYFLTLIAIILSVVYTGINKLFGNYLVDASLNGLQNTYFNQIIWSEALDAIFPIVGLIYFIWKLKSSKKTVANNTYN